MSKMKVLVAGSALGAAILAGPAAAAVTGTVAATSEYTFRGITSSDGAAVQGSLDWSDGGLYAGIWGSNTAPLVFDGTEVDLYGGYKFKLSDAVEVDIGAIYYLFPESEQISASAFDADYPEIYGGVNLGNFSAKLYYASKYFGELSADESATYLNLAYNMPLKDTLGLKFAVGYSDGDGVENFFDLLDDGALNASAETQDYLDYSITLTKTLDNGFAASFGLVGTDIDDSSLDFNDDPKFVVTLSKGFEI
ncbi:MAG TPA: TorF family putative porin [Nevskiales bacterium]|nr:TorF family putative porin [Nevskiales bacterium]